MKHVINEWKITIYDPRFLFIRTIEQKIGRREHVWMIHTLSLPTLKKIQYHIKLVSISNAWKIWSQAHKIHKTQFRLNVCVCDHNAHYYVSIEFWFVVVNIHNMSNNNVQLIYSMECLVGWFHFIAFSACCVFFSSRSLFSVVFIVVAYNMFDQGKWYRLSCTLFYTFLWVTFNTVSNRASKWFRFFLLLSIKWKPTCIL